MESSGKSISLVLGSGGARGLAHIGIIQWLEEAGYKIESIAGSSIGALVGGVYALGKLEEFSEWVKAINTVEMIKLLDFSLGSGGLVKGDKIISTLLALTGDSLIEELPIAFTAVAADMTNEKEVWMRRGPLFDAIRASISLPLIFKPVEYRGVQLLDGGILNPVPIAPTFGDHTDLTIAVNLSGPPDLTQQLPEHKEPSEEQKRSVISQKVSSFIDSIMPVTTTPSSVSMYAIAYQAIDAMQGTIARQKLAAYPPDQVLEIPRNLCGMLEFDRAEEMIEFGYNLARKEIPSLIR
ncbi:patatin-like phospholipase family protein [Oceanicoccus sp. KOV_DT_Chl]|uniref:patatin-like phospholipase family protein n=1 Tax=Oceanicoccus sp. KOV_DT_Chl TaxID=1904639 RepID=UPI000C7ABD3E|nr:patatin-like phospholipase family protein [Oceanicoccus sp. KOV_DT_Chl]